MPSVHETAYPRLKASVSPKDLREIYTPSNKEHELAKSVSRGFTARVSFLVVLKTFQRLGYYVPIAEVPIQIIRHVGEACGGLGFELDVASYDDSGTRRRHVAAIRKYVDVRQFDANARAVLSRSIRDAPKRKTTWQTSSMWESKS